MPLTESNYWFITVTVDTGHNPGALQVTRQVEERPQLSGIEDAFTRDFQCFHSSQPLSWPCSGVLRLRPRVSEGFLHLSGLPILLNILEKTRKRTPWICHSSLGHGLSAPLWFILSNAEELELWGGNYVLGIGYRCYQKDLREPASLWHHERMQWAPACCETENGSSPETKSTGTLIFNFWALWIVSNTFL